MKVEVRGTSPYWLSRNGGVETMAMPQRDDSPTPMCRGCGNGDRNLRTGGADDK